MSEETATDHTSQFSLDYARENNLKIVLPRPRQIQIDIDNDADYAQFTQAWDMLRDMNLGAKGFSERPSRNGGEGRHITCDFYVDITPLERIVLQAILGSDWRRELFSFARLKEGEVIPTLFYEKADDSQQKEYPSINRRD